MAEGHEKAFNPGSICARGICVHDLQVEVPEWYTRGLLPTPGSPENRCAAAESAPAAPTLQFDVLEGDPRVLDDCPDTVSFLALLSDLDRAPGPGDAAQAVLPEQRAARGLFRFDVRPCSSAHHAHLSKAPTISHSVASLHSVLFFARAAQTVLGPRPVGCKAHRLWSSYYFPLASPLIP